MIHKTQIEVINVTVRWVCNMMCELLQNPVDSKIRDELRDIISGLERIKLRVFEVKNERKD